MTRVAKFMVYRALSDKTYLSIGLLLLAHKEGGLKINFLCFSGLKSSEDELDKMRCVKCNFQAYYDQQYQDHIATHTEDVSKCKCCSYVTFDKDDLLIHFRVSTVWASMCGSRGGDRGFGHRLENYKKI